MIIEAMQNIDPDTELTISYGGDYFRNVARRCGTADCLQKKKKDQNKQKAKDGSDEVTIDAKEDGN